VTKKLNFKIFGDRVLLEKATVKQGSIIVPDNGQDLSRIGRIVALGDGKRPGVKTLNHNGHYYQVTLKDVEMLVKVGDLVYFETNAVTAANTSYDMGNEILVNVSHGEIIAKIKGRHLDGVEITFDNFELMPDYVLVKPFMREPAPGIVVPEVSKKAMTIYFRVAKIGSGVTKDINIDDEIILTQGYCRPLQIEREDYGYIHQNEIHGVVEESRILT
jgi:co-chaperonin GroES (HSP10)